MTRPTDLSLERVAAAAEALLANGIEPTVRALRVELGGSDSTISPLLRLWKKQGPTRQCALAPVTIPSDVAAVLRGWVEGQLAQARERQEAALTAEKDLRASAESLAEQSTGELKVVRQKLADTESSLRQRHEQVIAVQSDLTSIMSQLAECERQKAETTQQLEQSRHDAANAQTRALLAEQKVTLIEARQPRTRARGNVDAARSVSGS